MNSRVRTMLIPVISVVIALLINAFIILMLGKNPLEAYIHLFTGAFGGRTAIAQTLIQATPLIYTGLAVAFAYQVRLFNIGAQGQIVVGGLAAAAVGAFVGNILINNIAVILIVSATAGFVWAGIAGFLKAKLGVHEVISTIMLNYIALYLEQYLLNYPLKEGGPAGPSPQTPPVADWVLFPKLIENTNLNYGFIVAILVAGIVYFVLYKTVTGFEIKSVGFNSTASENAGINVKWRIILAMGIAGAIAGLGGA
ncbi:MAG: ABC transporter permease, partial [Spirochaetota bacterium]